MCSCAEERKEEDKKESIAQQRLPEKEDTVLHFRKCFASPSYFSFRETAQGETSTAHTYRVLVRGPRPYQYNHRREQLRYADE